MPFKAICLVFVSTTLACGTTVDSLGGRRPDGGESPFELEVPAARHWVSSGHYLRPSDTVTLSAHGAWTTNSARWAPHGPEGTDESGGNCKVGELAALIGFDFTEKANGWRDVQVCIGRGTTFAADRAGILYLGANDDDVSFADGYRMDNAGSAFVTIDTRAPPTPTLSPQQIAGYVFPSLAADALEVRTEHLLLEQPKSALVEHQSEAPACLERYEALYLAELDLSGQAPENPIRFAMTPSGSFEGRWGEPLQIRDVSSALSDCKNLARDHWVWVHMMGHSFHYGMDARYLIGGGSSQAAFANLSATYALEQLGLAQATHGEDMCAGISVSSYEALVGDPWSFLCLLLELKDTFGWQAWQSFFRFYHASGDAGATPSGTTDPERWSWFRDTMNQAAGIDVTRVLVKYHVPLP